MNKKKFPFWIAAFLVLAFAAGIVGGIVGERHFLQKKRPGQERRPPHFPSMEKMAEDLSLTREQQEKIQEIFRKNEERFKELRGHIEERLAAIRVELKAEIDAVLTPEQRRKLEEMIESHRVRSKEDYEKRRQKYNHSKPKR